MAGHGRPPWVSSIAAALLTVLIIAACAAEAMAGPPHWPAEIQPDAELADICFVDPDRGWAVGDRGVIWTTDDGGRHWQLQASGVSCRLNSISLIDDQHGWAAGGWTHRWTHRTTGVVLRTKDGGRHWEQLPDLHLAKLQRIIAMDGNRGWIIGRRSALYPSALLQTADGGRNWSGVASAAQAGWIAADFAGSNQAVLIDIDGRVAWLDQHRVEPAETPQPGLRRPRQVRMAGQTGWLVGDGGLVWKTSDGGRHWQPPPTPLPPIARLFDFCAVAVHEQHCWVAGAPGSCVFHTPDGGRSWQVVRTGQGLPIRSLYFLDAHHGWAAGALGTIVATRDGGQTWRRQRGGAQRAAMLIVTGEPERLPFELVARLAGNQGYLTVAEVLGRRDVEPGAAGQTALASRVHEAVVAAGGSSGQLDWRFPLRQSGLPMSAEAIVSGWQQANSVADLQWAERQLAAKIRQWRPDIIVTDPLDTTGRDPLGTLVNQLVLRGVKRAAEPSDADRQLAEAGLARWKVKKVFTAASQPRSASVQLVTTELAHRLGRPLADVASDARALLVSRPEAQPTMLGFDLLLDDLPAELQRSDFFAALSLPPGGPARRRLHRPPPIPLDALRRSIQKRRAVHQLLGHAPASLPDSAAWLAQLDELTGGLNQKDATDLLYELAWCYQRDGKPQLAAEVLGYLLDHAPEHELAEAALLWLVAYYSSGEAAWWMRTVQEVPGDPTATAKTATTAEAAAPVSEVLVQRLAAALQRPGQETIFAPRATRARQLGALAEQKWPALYAEPQMRFPLAAAERRLGAASIAQRFYRSAAHGKLPSAWVQCAQAELWLKHPSRVGPKPVFRCPLVGERPRLDGRLDEPAWQPVEPIALRSPLGDDAQWPANVWLARDDQFLFLAARCRKAAGVQYPPGGQARPRDPDLSQRDRIDLLIDVDRDYRSFYRLTIDHRGWTGEACCGAAAWNPTWYVAAAADGPWWTIEAAIPLDQLVPQLQAEQDCWAVGVQRIVPGRGFQSWTRPAAVHPRPEGFGLLLFTPAD